jgi:hypothetical protein
MRSPDAAPVEAKWTLEDGSTRSLRFQTRDDGDFHNYVVDLRHREDTPETIERLTVAPDMPEDDRLDIDAIWFQSSRRLTTSTDDVDYATASPVEPLDDAGGSADTGVADTSTMQPDAGPADTDAPEAAPDASPPASSSPPSPHGCRLATPSSAPFRFPGLAWVLVAGLGALVGRIRRR